MEEVSAAKNTSTKKIAKSIRDIRVDITHGYSYYYDFKKDDNIRYQILKLDMLIKCMSLKWMGFTDEEIEDYTRGQIV